MSDANVPRKVYWDREIYNSYQPNNKIRIRAEESGKWYRPYEMYGNLFFADGSSKIAIIRESENSFKWINDDKVGTARSYDEALENMPELVTHAEHWDETEVIDDCQYQVGASGDKTIP